MVRSKSDSNRSFLLLQLFYEAIGGEPNCSAKSGYDFVLRFKSDPFSSVRGYLINVTMRVY